MNSEFGRYLRIIILLLLAWTILELLSLKQGDLVRASENINKALDIRKQALGEDHPDLGMSFNSLGLLLTKEKKYSEALDWFSKSLDIYTKNFEEGTSRLWGRL